MSYPITKQSVLFDGLANRPVHAVFDQEAASSDGGALLLAAAERRVGLLGELASCLPDERQEGKVRHALEDLVSQRVYALATGYPDCNDAARLRDDPIHKMLVGREPVGGEALASQPTLSRFENSASPRALYRMAMVMAERIIERHRRRLWDKKVRRITIDLDATHDPTHGEQQMSLFNGKYGTHCYLPLLGFISFNGEADQHLLCAMLRPGTAPAKRGGLAVLRRLVPMLREAFPKAKLLARLDAGFASPEIYEWLEAAGLLYAIGLPKNEVLARKCEPDLERARERSETSGKTWQVFGEGSYQAGSWSRPRRVIWKAEVTRYPGREPRDNPRFVVTNMQDHPVRLYDKIYCRRGEAENRIKELKEAMALGRTSCCRFWANQLRVLLTVAAYALMQELRGAARATKYEGAQAWTLREHLLKLGVWVQVSVRRIVLHLPMAYPFREEWLLISGALGARPG